MPVTNLLFLSSKLPLHYPACDNGAGPCKRFSFARWHDTRVTRRWWRQGLLFLLPGCFSIFLLLWCSAGMQNTQWYSSQHVLVGTPVSIFSGKFCQCPKLASWWFSSTSMYSFLFSNLGLHLLSKHPVKISKKRNWLWRRRAFFQIFLSFVFCLSPGVVTAPLYLPFLYSLQFSLPLSS